MRLGTVCPKESICVDPCAVPLELRCALDADLNSWSEDPEYLFNVSWWRAIPYDPARPWKDTDGNWYVMLSMDG